MQKPEYSLFSRKCRDQPRVSQLGEQGSDLDKSISRESVSNVGHVRGAKERSSWHMPAERGNAGTRERSTGPRDHDVQAFL